MDGACSTRGTEEVHTKFRSGSLKGKGHSEYLGVNGRIILERISGKKDWKMWTGCICLKTGTSGGLGLL